MKKNIYITPETTVYETISEGEILAGSLPKGDEEKDIIIDEEEILSKPYTPPTIDLWEEEEE
ncbi:hypothetical protein HPS54_02355 [Prevotella sp. PCHR]|uniref:Uncharacterized protein n=1 Tax=Xylanibacter caecicola TaxID=2736294 RepID=A0ABX2AZ10_9BACT|nr:hypothetical protein [Xylanibacter caecicola]NPE24372.1 hypothetical protein [Xylanibacter caecicola]